MEDDGALPVPWKCLEYKEVTLGSWERLLGGTAQTLVDSLGVGSRLCSGQRIFSAAAGTPVVSALYVFCGPSGGNIYLYLFHLFRLVDLPQPILKCINPRYHYL